MNKIRVSIQWLSNQSIPKLRIKLLRPLLMKRYTDYCSEDFIASLEKVGICSGDSVFLMCSQDKIYLKTGKILPTQLLLKDLIHYLGQDGTLMTLCFPLDRENILKKNKIFNAKKTPTECGIFAEILRRKRGSIRSLNPIFSVISYGKKAQEFSNDHHQSPYPFGSMSPYYKLMTDGGKYLGIGVGFEAFTPCHMIEDYFKDKFKHKIYYDFPQEFRVICPDEIEKSIITYTRNPSTFPRGGYDPLYYFNLLNIKSHQTLTQSGIKLFTFTIKDFFDAAISIYDTRQITVWDTGSLKFLVSKKIKNLVRPLLKPHLS